MPPIVASNNSNQDLLLNLKKLRERIYKQISLELLDRSDQFRQFYSLNLLLGLLICRLVKPRSIESVINSIDQTKVEIASFFDQLSKLYPPLLELFANLASEELICIPKKVINDAYIQIKEIDQIKDMRILGQLYEDYLHNSVSERRKEQGIFYTPKFIIHFFLDKMLLPILREQLKLLKSSNLEEIKPIRILDPACGTGSFILQTFHYMLEFYQDNLDKPDLLDIKQYIVESCLFGTDNDSYAIAIAQIGLLILSGVGIKSKTNIKTGNVLIRSRSKIYEELQPFIWEAQFPSISKSVGFDIIFGNPPYVNVEKIPKRFRKYLLESYALVHKRLDLYIPFLELSYDLIKPGGKIGYIIPYSFLYERYALKWREKILSDSIITSILDLTALQVFRLANIRNICLILEKPKYQDKELKLSFEVLKPIEKPVNQNSIEYSTKSVPSIFFLQIPSKMFRLDIEKIDLILLQKIREKSLELEDICYVNWGARTGNVKKYIVDTPGANHKRMINGRDVKPYFIKNPEKYMIYEKEKLYNPMFEELFENEKLIIPDITGKQGIIAALDSEHLYAEHTVSLAVKWCVLEGVKRRGLTFSTLQKKLSEQYDLRYLLAQINSSISQYFFCVFLSGGLHTYPNDIKSLPIFRIDFSDDYEKKNYREIIQSSSELINLKKIENNIPSNRTRILEKRINDLTINLYSLEKKEINHIRQVISK